MQNMRCITPREMRDINRTCILEYLRQRGAVSRSAIANDLCLSLSSVVRITDELTEDRFVRLDGTYEYSGGRRRPLISLDTPKNVVVSVAIVTEKATACLYDIMGNTLESRTVYDHNQKGEACIQLIQELADEMIALQKDHIIRGISISVPAVVVNGNKVIGAHTLGLNEYYLADRIQPHFPYPVFIENDVNLAALGELWFGCGKLCDDLIYIKIGKLIGMGIILGRSILRGSHHGAGELGSLLLDVEQLKNQFYSIGALEECISGFGLNIRSKSEISKYKDIQAYEKWIDVFEEAKEGAKWPKAIIDDFMQKLAMVIVDVATLFDPQIIILGGDVIHRAEEYLPQVYQMIQGKTPNPIQVEQSNLGKNVHLLGGCASVIQNVMNYTMYKRMV